MWSSLKWTTPYDTTNSMPVRGKMLLESRTIICNSVGLAVSVLYSYLNFTQDVVDDNAFQRPQSNWVICEVTTSSLSPSSRVRGSWFDLRLRAPSNNRRLDRGDDWLTPEVHCVGTVKSSEFYVKRIGTQSGQLVLILDVFYACFFISDLIKFKLALIEREELYTNSEIKKNMVLEF